MNLERLYDCAKPRHRAWVKYAELTAGQTDGTYTVNDQSVAAVLGDGSEIIVIDQPGMILFWDAGSRLAYDWTAEEG